MYTKGKQRPLLFAALMLLCVLPGRSALSSDPLLVWFSDHRSVKAIDSATNQVTHVIDVQHEVSALAQDPAGNHVWVLLDKSLVKLSVTGTELLRVDLLRLRPGLAHPTLLAVNPYKQSVWIAADRALLHVSGSGELLGYWSAPHKIESIAVDHDESVWVTAHTTLIQVSTSGVTTQSVELKEYLQKARLVAVDGLGGVVWVGDIRRILKIDLLSPGAMPSVVDLPSEPNDIGSTNPIQAIDVHPMLGTLWVVTPTRLFMYSRSAAQVKTVEIPSSVGRAKSLAFEPRDLSLWMGGSNGVGRFTGAGDFIASVPAEKEAARLAASRFAVYPTVSIIDPPDGSVTNNPRPRFRFSLGSRCHGTPCLLPDAYSDSLSLSSFLNGDPIGSQFLIGGGEATYDPPARLPEGLNTVTARATDLFGHSSEEATGRFVVDTVPPRFLSVSPSDGSVLNVPALTIRGSIDDPNAHVVLTKASGEGIGLAGASFNFSVVLHPGANNFVLTARDTAGNETSTALSITYNDGLSIDITSPASGGVLNTRHAVVTGDIRGPSNVGVTVGGVIAHRVGNRFYANVPLEPGENILQAVATAPNGATANDTVTITVNSASGETIAISVEPETGIAPLTIRVTAVSNTANNVANIHIDADGDGSAEASVSNPTAPLEYTYATPGVYRMQVSATDSVGAGVHRDLMLVVNDSQEMTCPSIFGPLDS